MVGRGMVSALQILMEERTEMVEERTEMVVLVKDRLRGFRKKSLSWFV